MKKYKSAISVLLAVMLVLSAFTAIPLTAHAEEAAPSFVVDTVTAGSSKKNVAVTVNVKNNPGVASIALDIHYDESALTLTNFSYNTAALGGASTVPFNEKAKPACLSMVNGTANITDDFTFATLYFDVADTADGSYDITLTYDENNIYDINEDNVAFQVVNGKIIVDGAEPTESTQDGIGTNPAFAVDTVTATSGEKNVAVTVNVKNNPGVASIALDIHYDESALTLINFSYNTEALSGASTVPFDEKAKPACLSMVNGTANITGDFTFATLYFDVADTSIGSYDITLTYDENNVYDINEDNVAFKIVNGKIIVQESGSTEPTEAQTTESDDVTDPTEFSGTTEPSESGDETEPTESTQEDIGSNPAFVVDTATATSGEKNVAVTVNVKNNPGIASIALDIHYDESALTLTNFSYNTEALSGASTVPFDEKAKPACLSMVNGTANITGDFTFATLYFDVADTAIGSYDITLTYDENNVYDINEDNIAFKIVNGKIIVQESESTEPTEAQTTESDPTTPTETETPVVTDPTPSVTDPTESEPADDTTPTESGSATDPTESESTPAPTQPSTPAPTTPSTPKPSTPSQTKPATPSTTKPVKPATDLGKGASGAAVEAAILAMKTDKDPKGSTFNLLQVKNTKTTNKSIKISYKKPSGTKKFVIYGARCGNDYKVLKTVTAKSFTYKGLKKGTYYKFLVVALDSKGKVVATSKTIHVATKGGNFTNPKKVTITNASKAKTLKKGTKLKLKAKVIAKSKKLKLKDHRSVKLESTKPSVVKVSGKNIIAKKTGTATVYAYAQNGVMTKVKVTVKK